MKEKNNKKWDDIILKWQKRRGKSPKTKPETPIFLLLLILTHYTTLQRHTLTKQADVITLLIFKKQSDSYENYYLIQMDGTRKGFVLKLFFILAL